MQLNFSKYQGTGNDFIMLDNRMQKFDAMQLPIDKLCNRRFGIGADGLIVLEYHSKLDFHMIYFNADGSQSFCGNGSRCAIIFAYHLGMLDTGKRRFRFESTDGEHEAELLTGGQVLLGMHDVDVIETVGEDFVLNTGSPHYIKYVSDLNALEIVAEAHKIRYSDRFKNQGINVNFVVPKGGGIAMRTYERGVEDETLSCGTGVTAAALVHHIKEIGIDGDYTVSVSTPGGELQVHFGASKGRYREIYLQGPAAFVYSGEVSIDRE